MIIRQEVSVNPIGIDRVPHIDTGGGSAGAETAPLRWVMTQVCEGGVGAVGARHAVPNVNMKIAEPYVAQSTIHLRVSQ